MDQANPNQIVFENEGVKVTAPAYSIKLSADLTPTVIEKDELNGKLTFQVADSDELLEPVTVQITMGALNFTDLMVYAKINGEWVPSGLASYDNTTNIASFEADHFSEWTCTGTTLNPASSLKIDIIDYEEHSSDVTCMGPVGYFEGKPLSRGLKFEVYNGAGEKIDTNNVKHYKISFLSSIKSFFNNLNSPVLDEGTMSFCFDNTDPNNADTSKFLIKVYAENEVAKMLKSGGNIRYVMDAYLGASSSLTFNYPDDETKTAFEIIRHFTELADFWRLKSSKSGFVASQREVTWPDPDGSYFYNKGNVIGLAREATSDFGMNQGDGDSAAHEYAHWATRFLYGSYDYSKLSTTSAQHSIGDKTNENDAFKEDLAYFAENAFDGILTDELDKANIKLRLPEIVSTYQNYINYYIQARANAMSARTLGGVVDGKDEAGWESSKSTFLGMIRQYYEDNNEFVNSAINNPGEIDGFGALVLWDLYKSIGANGYKQIWDLVAESQPRNFNSFVASWSAKYGTGIMEVVKKYIDENATLMKTPEEILAELQSVCYDNSECDDANPCTEDYCMRLVDIASPIIPGQQRYQMCSMLPVWKGSHYDCSGTAGGTCMHYKATGYVQDDYSKLIVNDNQYGESAVILESYRGEAIPSSECTGDRCFYMCCQKGEVQTRLTMPNELAYENTNCNGVSGEQCISYYDTWAECCTPNDCVSENAFGNRVQSAAIFHGGKTPLCINNLCVYVKTLPKEAVITCAEECMYSGCPVRCTYTYPEE
jgi:hypothetical protein